MGKKKKTGPTASDEEIRIAFVDKYEWLGNRGCCKNLLGGKDINCDCLSIFKDPETREATAQYAFKWAQKSFVDKKQPLIDWYRYANASPGGITGKDKPFLLPFDGTGVLLFDVNRALKTRICTSALLEIFGLGQRLWLEIRKAALTTGVAKPHWSAGSKRSIGDDVDDEDDEIGQSLHDHFKCLMQLGEVRATRFVMKEVEGGGTQRVTRDNNEEDVFLPSTKGIRPCYYRWCHDRGWDCEAISTGAIKKQLITLLKNIYHKKIVLTLLWSVMDKKVFALF